ncbi:MAG: glycosyltransferase family 2 protein [Myxococcota bacterium]|nr:glycosyltransferase family 2 protein [Myxococcota bacterium]
MGDELVPGSSPRPRLTFGLPVRNGEDSLPKCLDSILAQDFADFEVVVCDNCSTDRTREILDEYAAKDDRVGVCLNEENVGLVENFNRVFRLARGEYFRWIGADDWLEPGYAAACVDALDRDPDAIAATTFFGLHRERGGVDFEQFQGEYLESPDPARRLSRLLWFFHAGVAIYEPTYATMRREVLARTHLFQIHHHQDWLLTTEMCLAGRFVHVPECLFHRNWPEVDSSGHYAHLLEMYPERAKYLAKSPWLLMRAMFALVDEAEGLSATDKRHCRKLIFWWCLGRVGRQARSRLRKLRRSRGITRAAVGAGDATE